MEFDKFQTTKYTESSKDFKSESRIDGRLLNRKSVQDDKIQSSTLVADGSITNAKLATDSVSKVKVANDAIGNNELDVEEITVNVSAGQASGTGIATSGSIIIGHRPAGNVDQFVDNISISGTTVTVTLGSAATAQCNFVVILLKQ